MKPILTYVYSYYDNLSMFKRQIKEWKSYKKAMKDRLEIIVTDDCSQKTPIQESFPVLKNFDIPITIFQIKENVQWNWLACRNIGAHHSKSKWLLLTDMDHMIDKRDTKKLFNFLSGPQALSDFVYLFERIDAPNRTHYKPHNDSFMMTKDLYWKIGGYDEELSGNYGTSGRYRNRAFSVALGNKRLNIPLTRFSREVIPDASTVGLVRKGPGRDPKAIQNILAKKEEEGRENEILTLTFPYERVYSND